MEFSTDLQVIENKVEEQKRKTIFDNMNKPAVVEEPKPDKKAELVEAMFQEAVVHEVGNNEDLKNQVLDTAKTYTETKMQVIKTEVDTEYKKAVFDNNADACESYGFNEKTTPSWAVRFMKVGYSIMLAIYLFLASFTVMPVIFLAKKMAVGLKKTWIAVVFAIVIYLGIVFVPLIIGLLQGRS
jgi:hypothetical protein